MNFWAKKSFVCIEQRPAFIKQVIRWTVLHLLALSFCITLFYHGFESDHLVLQLTALASLLLFQGILFTFLYKIVNIEGRVLDIYPEAPRFCSKHMGAIMLVPMVSLFFIAYLCFKRRRETNVPLLFRRPELLAETCLGIFIFTIITPIFSLLYPTLKLEVFNFWISTPAAYTITQTVEKVRSIAYNANDPSYLQVSDLRHANNQSFYVSALTFDLVRKKLLNDLPKVRTRTLASEHFERELSYVENLTEIMKWADNNKTMFSYFHKSYLFPTSGWDTSVAFLAEHYFLFSFKLEVHREVEHYFGELVNYLESKAQKEKLQKLKHKYYQLKAVRSLKQVEGTWPVWAL